MDNRLRIYLNRDGSYDAIKGNKMLHYNWSFVTYKIYNIQLITISPSYVPVGRLIRKPHIQMILQVQRSFGGDDSGGSNESILNFKQFESLRDKMTPKSIDDFKSLINGKTPDEILLLASKNDIPELVTYAIERGANLETKNQRGETPLISASKNDNLEILKTLIENGADVNARNTLGNTAMMLASFLGQTEIVKTLIENGADVNARGNDGQTALSWTHSKFSRTDTVKLLKKYGAEE